MNSQNIYGDDKSKLKVDIKFDEIDELEVNLNESTITLSKANVLVFYSTQLPESS